MATAAIGVLNFPNYNFRLKQVDSKVLIFDAVRKKWLICTPEEWVRQHLICWLIQEKNYPAALIAIESGLKINQLQRRSDVMIYQNNVPFILAECKAPQVKITQEVFDQLFRYNLVIKAPYLLVTNGLTHFFAQTIQEKTTLHPIEDLPKYKS